MAGILNKKTRVLDIVLTKNGRRQLLEGQLRPEFVSFSDKQADYRQVVSGSENYDKKIYHEVTTNLPQDNVTLEKDDSGNLISYSFSPLTQLQPAQSNPNEIEIFHAESEIDVGGLKPAGSTDFASLADQLLSSSIEHLQDLRIIKTKFRDVESFSIDRSNVTFTITNSVPFNNGPTSAIANLDSLEPIFFDKRTYHLDNFKFLPPMVKIPPDTPIATVEDRKSWLPESMRTEDYEDMMGIGQYQRIRVDTAGNPWANMNWDGLLSELHLTEADFQEAEVKGSQSNIWKNVVDDIEATNRFEYTSNPIAKEVRSISLGASRTLKNIVGQFFEVKDSNLQKLDVIDFGEFVTESGNRKSKHVFFVGKIFIDRYDIPTYINLFTLIFD